VDGIRLLKPETVDVIFVWTILDVSDILMAV
jgi:hypothetical protein